MKEEITILKFSGPSRVLQLREGGVRLEFKPPAVPLPSYRSRDIGFPDGSVVKNPPAMQETQVQSLSPEDPLEKDMATHSSILAWRTPWTEEPGGLQPMGSQRVGHDSDNTQRYRKQHSQHEGRAVAQTRHSQQQDCTRSRPRSLTAGAWSQRSPEAWI